MSWRQRVYRGCRRCLFEMEEWGTGDVRLDRVPSQSYGSTRPMKPGAHEERPSTVFLCKDSACIKSRPLSNCRDCDGPPKMARYAPYPTRICTECSADYQPCEDLTEHCTPGCVQVTVPCLDSCTPTDCNSDTCPENITPHSLWAVSDWHAHCNMPPQFAAINHDLQFADDLQQLVIFISSLAGIGIDNISSLTAAPTTTIPKMRVAFPCPLPMQPARQSISPTRLHKILAWPRYSGPTIPPRPRR